MDVDHQTRLPLAHDAPFNGLIDDSASPTNGTGHEPSTNKRKYEDLMQLDGVADLSTSLPSSPPHQPSSPQLPPSSPPSHADRATSPTPAPAFKGHKAYIARSTPHVLDHFPTPSGSRTPSIPPSGRSSPSSEDDGRSTPDGASSTPTPSHQSHHTVPEGYRGPPLRKNDAEDFAPSPHLASVPGSTTLYNTVNFAINRNGWRYTAAGPASQHLPQTVFKTLETQPPTVHWCWSDRSPFTHISADADVISTDKGFRSARTNIGVREGEWYAEIEILPPEHLAPGVGSPHPPSAAMKDGPHLRLGWGRREAPVNAPVGFDGYSYGFRDKTGDKVTLSRPLPYGKPFEAGDVVGLYIKLPTLPPPQDESDPANIKRERIAIRYKGQLYFESLEYPRTREMEQLMERSRKGNSIEEALKGIEGTGVFEPFDPQEEASSSSDGMNGSAGNGNGSGAPAASTSGGGGGSAKVKNRKNPGTKEKPSGPSTPSLRPVPKLPGSKIGFFVNGEPQGIAFRDLFDFRPLRVKGFSNLRPSPPTKASSSSRPSKANNASSAAGKIETGEPVINVKARENVFDDGALGYFPFVSSYGGARARLITGENGFRFPPPDDIEAALEGITSSSSVTPSAETGSGGKWKPLHARFAGHLAEMWEHDLADEAKAQVIATKQAEEKAKRNNAAKERYAAAKKKHAAAMARNATASPGPSVQTPTPAVEEEGEDGDGTITSAPRVGAEMVMEAEGERGQVRSGVEVSDTIPAAEEMSKRSSIDVQTPPPAARLATVPVVEVRSASTRTPEADSQPHQQPTEDVVMKDEHDL